MIPVLSFEDPSFKAEVGRLVARSADGDDKDVSGDVRAILADVRARGDAALLDHTRRLDGRPDATLADLEVGAEAIDRAAAALDPEVHAALARAAERIRAFHAVQAAQIQDAVLDDGAGVRASLVVRPLARAGVYVPGGTAAYPSTVLMNVVPAKVAGVREVIMVSPARGGAIPPAVLAAARLAGADRIFAIGGAQAVGALAFGTAMVPRVDKIVGPGNAWVAEAKRQVYGEVAIDQIAGPSEVLILADEAASPEVVAADLLAQAEHDVRSAAVLVTWSRALVEAVKAEVERQCAALPRAAFAAAALRDRGGLILARDRRHAFELANRYAPEHLGLSIRDPDTALGDIHAAGAVFLGEHTPEALGDYNAGINHVLPTSGTARFGAPLSVHDFIRRMNVLRVEARGLERLGGDAARLAREEGLEAHARAIEARRARR